jgi:hypothetical protein
MEHLVPASMQSTNLFDIYLFLYVQSWTPDDGRKDCPKHVEWCSVNSKNYASSWFYYRNIKGAVFSGVSGQSVNLVGHLHYMSRLKVLKLRPTQSSRRCPCRVLIMDRDQFIFTIVMMCRALVWAVVNTVMNLRVPWVMISPWLAVLLSELNVSWLTERRLASLEPCPMQVVI